MFGICAAQVRDVAGEVQKHSPGQELVTITLTKEQWVRLSELNDGNSVAYRFLPGEAGDSEFGLDDFGPGLGRIRSAVGLEFTREILSDTDARAGRKGRLVVKSLANKVNEVRND